MDNDISEALNPVLDWIVKPENDTGRDGQRGRNVQQSARALAERACLMP